MILRTTLTALILAGAVSTGHAANDKAAHRFGDLDINGDGQITQTEMTIHREARFSEADRDQDGRLSKEELEARISSRAGDQAPRRVERMLQKLDANGDNHLSRQELQKGRAKGRFARMDKDANGTISQAEFAAAKKAKRDRAKRAQ